PSVFFHHPLHPRALTSFPTRRSSDLAGMSCALWLHNYGMHPVIIEKAGALGGMARLSPYPNEWRRAACMSARPRSASRASIWARSEEHTSELQSLTQILCRLLLGKKK